MSRLLLAWVLIAAACFSCSNPGRADEKKSVLGRKIDSFTLKDSAGKAWSLEAHKDAKAIVIVFLGTECPINNAYLPRLADFHKTFGSRGVALIAINANQQDIPRRMAEHAAKNQLPFPVLKDAANIVADRFGAERTPEAFVLDAERVIRYRGRIDDQFGVGFKRPKPTRDDLAEAVDEVLAGKAVTRPETAVAGCFIARVNKVSEAPAKVTFTQHVAPLLQQHCQECHRPGQIGPMPLLTYDDAAAWSETIREVIAERRMPPWHADPAHGSFANNRRLPDQDRDTLLAWVAQGCAQGPATAMPPPRSFPEGWTIGKPDLILSMKEAVKVPATAPDGGIRYQYIIVPTNFDEDKWIQAAEVHPGSREVVHHIIVYTRELNRPRGQRTPDGIGDGMLVAYAPGDQPAIFPPGSAKKIPKGRNLIFQMHYTPDGTERLDRSSVGLIFAKETPKLEARTRSIAQQRFMIPPGTANHEVTSAMTFEQDVLLLSLFPHMHLRGKDFNYRVVYPDGKTDTLLNVPRYDFGWQTIYRLKKPMTLPKGSRIECTAHFDNSKDNPNNPNPALPIFWGEQTWEEMMIGFVDYCYLGQPETK